MKKKNVNTNINPINNGGGEYKPIEYYGCNLDDFINELQRRHNLGEKVEVNFNGHWLNSDMSEDECYKTVTDYTKSEFKELQRKKREEWEAEERAHKERIPMLTKEYVDKGREILDKDYWKLWEECVPIRLGDLYKGMELQASLDIIAELNKLNDKMEEKDSIFSKAKDILNNQGHSGMSYGLMKSMLKSFCKYGVEFVDYLND